MKQSIVLIVSVVVGLLAAVLTRTYLVSKDAEVRQFKDDFLKKNPPMEVLCFKRDIPSGTRISKADLGIISVPASGLRGQALTEADLDSALGRKLLNGRKTREILFWSDIEGGKPRSSGLAGNIKSEMRAVSINCSGAASVSGMVRPNDHVDVIASFSFPTNIANSSSLTNSAGNARPMIVQELVTYTILQNVHVLATGKETANSLGGQGGAFNAGSYSTVTLEVTPREAEMLVFAEQIKGRISLALRKPSDTTYEKDLPQVDLAQIRKEIVDLNKLRQEKVKKER